MYLINPIFLYLGQYHINRVKGKFCQVYINFYYIVEGQISDHSFDQSIVINSVIVTRICANNSDCGSPHSRRYKFSLYTYT